MIQLDMYKLYKNQQTTKKSFSFSVMDQLKVQKVVSFWNYVVHTLITDGINVGVLCVQKIMRRQ